MNEPQNDWKEVSDALTEYNKAMMELRDALSALNDSYGTLLSHATKFLEVLKPHIKK